MGSNCTCSSGPPQGNDAPGMEPAAIVYDGGMQTARYGDSEAAEADLKAKTTDIEESTEISKEIFAIAIQKTLDLAIEGFPHGLRTAPARRNELLRETKGDQEWAAEMVKTKINLIEEGKAWFMGLVPYLELPQAILYPTYTLLRRICLIAAVYGLDLNLEDTQARIVYVFAQVRVGPDARYELQSAIEFVWQAYAGKDAGTIAVDTFVTKVTNFEGCIVDGMGKDVFADKQRVISEGEYQDVLDVEPSAADYAALMQKGSASSVYMAWKSKRT